MEKANNAILNYFETLIVNRLSFCSKVSFNRRFKLTDVGAYNFIEVKTFK